MYAIVQATYPDDTIEVGLAMSLGLCGCDDLPETHREWETPFLREGQAKEVKILREIGMDDDDTIVTGITIADMVKL